MNVNVFMQVVIPEHAFNPPQKDYLMLVWQWRNNPIIQQNMHNNSHVKRQELNGDHN